MIITCVHGYFFCREETLGEAAQFNSLFSQDLTAKDDYHTFTMLAEAKDYSIVALPYCDLPAITTYQGNPWQVMEQNGFVYDLTLKEMVPVDMIVLKIDPTVLYNGFSMRGLIQPGSITKDWDRVVGYTCHANLDSLVFDYSELIYG